MTDNDKMIPRELIYAGKRYFNDSLSDAFVFVDNLDDELTYKCRRRDRRFVIGQVYSIEISESHRIAFDSAKEVDGRAPDDIVRKWSIEDASSRRAKQNESARKKAAAECRESWKETLEPIRRHYRNASLPQRRALRQLIIEWLDEA